MGAIKTRDVTLDDVPKGATLNQPTLREMVHAWQKSVYPNRDLNDDFSIGGFNLVPLIGGRDAKTYEWGTTAELEWALREACKPGPPPSNEDLMQFSKTLEQFTEGNKAALYIGTWGEDSDPDDDDRGVAIIATSPGNKAAKLFMFNASALPEATRP